MNNANLITLFKLTEGLYRNTKFKRIPPAESVDLDAFINLASKNNLLYHAVKELLLIPSFVEEHQQGRLHAILADGNENLKKIDRSIEIIGRYLPGSVLFKTFRGKDFLRIPNDVDVLTRNFEHDLNKLLKLGFRAADYNPREGSLQLLHDDMWKIHLHSKISWAWESFFDEEIIYQETRKELFNGMEVTVPNITIDVLIHVAHMNFEPLNLVLGELIYLFLIIPYMDIDLALVQSRKYRWKKTFLRTLNLINKFHYYLYGDILIQEPAFKKIDMDQVSFPYCFSRNHIVLTALEKRLLFYPLTRILKVINILIGGDTFTRYISPSDREKKEVRKNPA